MPDTHLVEKQTTYKPHIVSRLFWWWFVYLVPPQLGLLLYSVFIDHSSPDYYPLTFLLVALFFPVGLIPYCPPVGYIFYLGHLILTCSVQTRKWFRILIIILVVAIIINLAGCAEMNRQLSHFSP